MAKSRAEYQKEYRERKKKNDASYQEKERLRAKQNRVPIKRMNKREQETLRHKNRVYSQRSRNKKKLDEDTKYNETSMDIKIETPDLEVTG